LRPAIAVDAMGGDRAPREVVRGAVLAARSLHVEILLVGLEDVVRAELDAAGWCGDERNGDGDPGTIRVVPATEVIGMGESPAMAVRRKKGSSIARAVRLVRDGQAQAFVSAGNTGAVVASSIIQLRLLPTVQKPGIAVAIYAGPRPVIVCDVGANVEAIPEHLVQYGLMARLYATKILGVEGPRVGLVNIGEEGAKGNRLTKKTHELFRGTDLSFVGNVEGNEIFNGACDVAVCDGFTGNIVLKVSEGLAERLINSFKDLVRGAIEASTEADGGDGGDHPLIASLSGLKGMMDYAEFGGAPLLGVNGTVIIAHGRSDAKAISNAVRAALRMAEVDINRLIIEDLQAATAGS